MKDYPYAILTRLETTEKQTLGVLTCWQGINKLLEIKTLELPDEANNPQISRILAGTYLCRRVEGSPSFKYPHFDILNVEGRSFIKIHRGNFYNQIKGCILVGLDFADINKDGVVDVTNSASALTKLLQVMPEYFTLAVK